LVVSGDQMMVMKLAVMQPLLKEAQEMVQNAAEKADEAPAPVVADPEAAAAAADTQPGEAIFRKASKLLTAEHVAQVQGIFQLDITKDGATINQWTMDLKRGDGDVHKGPDDEANTTITLEESTLIKWLNQELDPIAAFMGGLLTVSGDQMMVMKLGVMQPLLKEAQAMLADGGDSGAKDTKAADAAATDRAKRLEF